MDAGVKKSVILELLAEAKRLFNEYGKIKNEPASLPGREMALSSALAAFLRQVLLLAQEFAKNTENESERGVLKVFAAELGKICK